jgi:transcriptional regulator with XRE-family HTH domain
LHTWRQEADGALARRKEYLVSIDDKAVGQRLKELRNQRGKTQVQLASILGMDQSLLSRYERGDLRLHAAVLASFAKALNVSTDAILGLQQSKLPGTQGSDERLLRRLRRIEGLPRRKKEALLTTIDTFLEQQD